MPLAPTAPSERLESLDVLRGLALLGVLLENLQHFVSPGYAAIASLPDATWLDRGGLWLVRFAFDNKVYMLFALLFGTGVGLQAQRAAAAGERFLGLHLWRMAVLFLFGLAHLTLWNGDILTTYALLGILLIPLRGRPWSLQRLVVAAGLLAPAALLALLLLLSPALTPEGRHSLETATRADSYPLRQTCFAFAMFVLGLAAARRRDLLDPAGFVAATRRLVAPALALGVAGNALAVLLLHRVGSGSLSGQGVLLELAVAAGAPPLALLYIHATCRGLTRPGPRRWLLPLAAVGRTTLSNYLLQTLIGVGLLAHAGSLGLGPVTPPRGLVLGLGIFGLQVAASRWWLARFRFGPAEWLWRSASYGSLQPWRRGPAPDPLPRS